MYLLFEFVYRWTTWHIPLLYSVFSTLILVQKKTELGQVHIYQDTCCKNFQTYLPVITYCSACTDHLDFIFIFYTHLDLLLWNPLILFLCVYNQHLQCLPCLSYCKTLFFFFTFFPIIYVFVWISTFLQHQYRFIDIKVTKFVCISKWLF